MATADTNHRLILLTPATGYRAEPFLEAAQFLGLEVIRGVDIGPGLPKRWNVPLPLDFREPEGAVARIVALARERPVRAVLAVDDHGSLIAARAAAALGLPHNAPEAALAARDKWHMRQMLARGGAPSPECRCVSMDAGAAVVAGEVAYPCVLKPRLLNGSRGVIRADGPEEFVAAFGRLRRLLEREGDGSESGGTLLVERFIPGDEFALEGLLTGGELRVLALFDKPDPLDGPFFEETLYVTPSRFPAVVQEAIAASAAQAAAALGLREGPIHAELRVNAEGAWIVEVAGRSIGGLCSRILRFGAGMSLEELILRHAVGMELQTPRRAEEAVGVMMIPIPAAGILRGVTGVPQAEMVPGIEEVVVSARLGQALLPLPEGASYLGFIFARGGTAAEVETALRTAHRELRFEVIPELPMLMSVS
jgi:biotin carboxylase